MSKLENFSGEEPGSVSNRLNTLVITWDSNINPVERRVSVTKGNDRDVHVSGFSEALMVKAGVADNDESWLLELLGVLIGKGTGNPLSTEVVGFGVGGEFEDGSLGIGST